MEKPQDIPQEPPVYTGETDVTLITLEKLKFRSVVSKTFIHELSKVADLKKAERDLLQKILAQYPDDSKIPVKEFAEKVTAKLIPIKATPVEPRYDRISLPAESKGNVQQYTEIVYQCPVNTAAGNIHFKHHFPEIPKKDSLP
jgi:hypothetical protein